MIASTPRRRQTKAELESDNRQLLLVIERHQTCIEELKRQRDELTQAILGLAGITLDSPTIEQQLAAADRAAA